MAPLNIERFDSKARIWKQVSQVKPQTVAKPIQNFLPDGRCELYFLECSGNNSMSTIRRTEIGAKTNPKGEVESYDADALTVFRQLRRGESVDIKIREGLRKRGVTIRLTQV